MKYFIYYNDSDTNYNDLIALEPYIKDKFGYTETIFINTFKELLSYLDRCSIDNTYILYVIGEAHNIELSNKLCCVNENVNIFSFFQYIDSNTFGSKRRFNYCLRTLNNSELYSSLITSLAYIIIDYVNNTSHITSDSLFSHLKSNECAFGFDKLAPINILFSVNYPVLLQDMNILIDDITNECIHIKKNHLHYSKTIEIQKHILEQDINSLRNQLQKIHNSASNQVPNMLRRLGARNKR
jgi:hypothetical protein